MGKLWIDREGNLLPVDDTISHEEWANSHGDTLEFLLNAGWVRTQNVPPPYLLIDIHLPLTAGQAKAVAVLLQNRFERVVVEFRNEAREFRDNAAALAYALSAAWTTHPLP